MTIDRDHMDADALVLFEVSAQRQHRGVLDGADDDFAAARRGFQCRQDRGIGAFGAAGIEYDLGRLVGTEQALHLRAGAAHRVRGCFANAVLGRGIAELLREIRQHRFQHARIKRGGGVGIEIDV